MTRYLGRPFLALALGLVSCSSPAPAAEVHGVTIRAPRPSETGGIRMGTARRPDGSMLTVDSTSLLLDGERFTPVMGEFHYSRYPEDEWREELLAMKAGGVDILATYVFWIHHEEVEGEMDWQGRKSLRHFVELARDAGLLVVARIGPWCHGEVRNGGLPDWIVNKGLKTRSDDLRYLAKVQKLYGAIARQLDGLLWRDGGPVIGVQVENEYGGRAEHLLSLERIARSVGLDTPLYTRTGWPELETPMPFGRILPLFGAYAEGFWDREITPMPGKYWKAFTFSNLRVSDTIATDQLRHRESEVAAERLRYPYLTCEIGGGMPSSYHRRIFSFPEDSESLVLTQIGSGSVLPGYYMYHGGTNPDGRLTTLQESQASGYWNDVPVKTYDFQAPIGEFGQLRPHYHLLRRLHLFLRDFGSRLATMEAFFPPQPKERGDRTTLRFAVRSDGASGFVFVNNYERLAELPPKRDVQFELRLPTGTLRMPSEPVTVPANARFFWPFRLDLAEGVRLEWATAQPIATLEREGTRTVFFAETSGVPPEFVLAAGERRVHAASGRLIERADGIHVRDLRPGTSPAIQIETDDGGVVSVVLLDTAQSLALWKGRFGGRERVFLTSAGLVLDGDTLRLRSEDPAKMSVGVFPPLDTAPSADVPVATGAEGLFQRLTLAIDRRQAPSASLRLLTEAGPPRVIPLGKTTPAVAVAPDDAEFASAAVWQVSLPADIDLSRDPILHVTYLGDVARVTLDGRLIQDDFYNGRALSLGLRRFAPAILKGDLRVAVLPLRKDAPILLSGSARPDFGAKNAVARIDRVTISETMTAAVTSREGGSGPSSPRPTLLRRTVDPVW